MSQEEPRSNIAFAAKLLDEGATEAEVVNRLEGRGLSGKEAARILAKLRRAEDRPPLLLSYVVVGIGALMVAFGLWVIVNAYNDPEVMKPAAGLVDSSGQPYIPLIRRMWRVTLMCWACGAMVLSTGIYKLARARNGAKRPPPPPPLRLGEGPRSGPTEMSVPDMKRFATKELVKGNTKDQIVRTLMDRGVPQDLATRIVNAAR